MAQSLPANSPGPTVLTRTGNAGRLVEHMATVGYLPALEDRLFFYCAVEMARIGNVALDQLLTDQAHHVVEMRWLCYHVLENAGKVRWAEIALRFNRTTRSVRDGANQVADLLKSPALHAGLDKLYRQLIKSFQNYQNSLPNGQY